MQLNVYACLGLLISVCLLGADGHAQVVPDTGRGDTLTVGYHVHIDAYADSLNQVLDSLEVSLLQTARTYQQIERLLITLPEQSPYLNLLPSVLPVELPIDAFRITSPFGMRRHPVHQRGRFHEGIDVKAGTGLIVKATAPGIVREVGYHPALGVFVRVQHAFGFETTYGHLSKRCVQPGQTVSRSQEIGKVGQTGLATGPHLHYTLTKNGSIIDPFDFCFLLRRRLWLYRASNESAVGKSASSVVEAGSSAGSYPNSRN